MTGLLNHQGTAGERQATLARLLGGFSASLVLGLPQLGSTLLALAYEPSLTAEIAQFARFLNFLGESAQ